MRIERTARARQESRTSPEIAADTPKENDLSLVKEVIPVGAIACRSIPSNPYIETA
jgi:hypothetical protein